jgi:hypothetical protein
MPNHQPEHMRRMVAESAAVRRTAKLAGLIANSPPLTAEQVASLQRLLTATELLDSEVGER